MTAHDYTLREQLARYLALRRALGYRLDKLERLAGQFCDWLAEQGRQDTFTTAEAVTWARLPADADPQWWGVRLAAVRTFAGYLDGIGVGVQVPPRNLLPARTRRATPFIYSQQDLTALLEACDHTFTHPLVAATMRTAVALMAATGIRIGEALRLTVPDLDTTTAVMTIRGTKHGPDRLIPLHPSTCAHLAGYRDSPDRRAVRPAPDGPLLVSTRGGGYHRSTIEYYFARAARTAGLRPRGRARPRPHDLRHTFASAHMAAAYRAGGDPQRTLALLATWLGHTSAAHTYWYLSATPELMALAAARPRAREAGHAMTLLAPTLQTYFTIHAHAHRDLARTPSPPTATPGGCSSNTSPRPEASPSTRSTWPCSTPHWSPSSSTTSRASAATASPPATPGSPRSARSWPSRCPTIPSTPTRSLGCWPSRPAAVRRPSWSSSPTPRLPR